MYLHDTITSDIASELCIMCCHADILNMKLHPKAWIMKRTLFFRRLKLRVFPGHRSRWVYPKINGKRDLDINPSSFWNNKFVVSTFASLRRISRTTANITIRPYDHQQSDLTTIAPRYLTINLSIRKFDLAVMWRLYFLQNCPSTNCWRALTSINWGQITAESNTSEINFCIFCPSPEHRSTFPIIPSPACRTDTRHQSVGFIFSNRYYWKILLWLIYNWIRSKRYQESKL